MVIVRTPYRISFAGGGTDFAAWFNTRPGAVVSTTINRYCYITCRELPPFFDYATRLVWSRIETVTKPDEIVHPAVRGAFKFLSLERPRLQLHHDGDLPAQAGTGSSAAFTVGLLHALYAQQGRLVSKRQLALDAMAVDQDLAGEVTGCQDHVAVAHGGLNLIKFGPRRSDYTVSRVPLTAEVANRWRRSLMLFYTGQSRTASSIEAAKWRDGVNESVLECQLKLVDRAVEALIAGDIAQLASVLDESWILKRSMASEVSNAQLDSFYDRAKLAGALGGKVIGAGGGGTLLLVVPVEKRRLVLQELRELVNVPFDFEGQGSQLIYYGEEKENDKR